LTSGYDLVVRDFSDGDLGEWVTSREDNVVDFPGLFEKRLDIRFDGLLREIARVARDIGRRV